MSFISEQIEKHTADISGFETSRDYISLSHCANDKEEILRLFLEGFNPTHLIRLKCYKGYQMERDLIERVKQVFSFTGGPYSAGGEIVAFDGLVKGHPDFCFEGHPADCKSVPEDKHLPDPYKLPRRVYMQMQGYMHYGQHDRALVIYESRESGLINDYWIRANLAVQQEIDEKMKWCVGQIRKAA